MRSVRYLGPGRLALQEIAEPPLGPMDVRVRVRACGVCGTDLHIFHGEKGSAEVAPPVALGHEFAGEVVETGASVSSPPVGAHVAVDPNLYCGTCRACRTGRKQLCERLSAVGVNRDGGFAETCVVPASLCYRLDDAVPFAEGAMAEPLSCCLHGFDRVGLRPGDDAVVVGGGAIGLLMVQLAKRAGAGTVALSEPVASRRALGLALGADFAFDPLAEDPVDAYRARTGRDGADAVIECAGRKAAAGQALRLAARGATVLLFGVPSPDDALDVRLFDVFSKELTIRGSFINPDTLPRAMELLNGGGMRIGPLITHRFPLERVEEAFAAQQGRDAVKVVVEP